LETARKASRRELLCHQQPLKWAPVRVLRVTRTRRLTTNTNTSTSQKAYRSLLQRLKRAGFDGEFVRAALLPDWWDDACADDASIIRDIEIRVARFLKAPLSTVADSTAPLALPNYAEAKLRRVREIDRDRLAPAIHVAIQVAAAVVRNMKFREPPTQSRLPENALRWRSAIAPRGGAPRLEDLAAALWEYGIPVVALEHLPAPAFQGMACVVDGRPVILLGYKHDEPGRVAFVVAHEAGHIAAGDCGPGEPIVDEEDEITDDAEIEVRADEYATKVLVGEMNVPGVTVDAKDFKVLAQRAFALEKERGVDASSVIFAWARRTGDYMTGSMAVKALYRHVGARKELQRQFKLHVDVDAASETDRALLWLCAGGWPTSSASAR